MNARMILYGLLVLWAVASQAAFSKCEILSEKNLRGYITSSAKTYDVDEHLLIAIAKVESNFNNCITSPKGASGVMQLMPETALEVGVDDVFNAKQNIDGGAQYLLKMINKFKRPQLYLAAYNAGPNAVKNKRYIPNYQETKEYIRKVLKEYQKESRIEDSFKAIENLTKDEYIYDESI